MRFCGTTHRSEHGHRSTMTCPLTDRSASSNGHLDDVSPSSTARSERSRHGGEAMMRPLAFVTLAALARSPRCPAVRCVVSSA